MYQTNFAKKAASVLFAFVLLFCATATVSAQGSVDAVLKDGQLLEQQQKWESALELYGKALRLFPEELQLQQHYTLVKQRSNIHFRMMDREYLEVIAAMTDKQEQAFVSGVLESFETCYLNPIERNDVFQRSVHALQVALADVDFCEKVIPNVPAKLRDSFRQNLETMDIPTITTREDLVQAYQKIAAQCEQVFRVNSAFFTMECIIGFVYGLDPYSAVLVPSQYRDLLADLRGQLVGIGVRLYQKDGKTWIYQVVENSPAHKAGVDGGELLVAVNGEKTEGLSLEQVSLLLQGKENTMANLTLSVLDRTSNQRVIREVAIPRSAIVVPSIGINEVLPDTDGVAYVQLQHFQNDTARELDRTLWNLYEHGMKKLVLDLRGNPGGILDSAVNSVDLFVPEGVIVSTQGNQQSEGSRVYHAKKVGTWRVPLVVLIDERSASSSEIFAGAIQDHQRGQLIGSRSYGKGLIQRICPIEGVENFGLRLTTSQFFSPKGQAFNLVGIEPDLKVRKALFPKTPEAEEAAVNPHIGVAAKQMFANDEVLQLAIQSFNSEQKTTSEN